VGFAWQLIDAAAAKFAHHDAQFADVENHYPDQAYPGPNWQLTSTSSWPCSFYPGALWLMYELTADAAWMAKAKKWTAGIAAQVHNTGTHDVGFMFVDSFGNGLRLMDPLDPDRPRYLQNLLTAATSLSVRFNAAVGCTRSWHDINNMSEFLVIIDNMMNLELLLLAHQRGGHAAPGSALNLWEMALSHADRTSVEHIRPDGSTYHVVDFNPFTGHVVAKKTAQGMNAESTWSRGQAWAIHGFTDVYSYTHDAAYLATAQAVADYWIDHVPVNDPNYTGPAKDWIPKSDFDSPYMGLSHKDSSAAAIAASGLLLLSTAASPPPVQRKYLAAAVATIQDLLSPAYFASDQNESPSLLVHGARRFPGENISYIWADYYLLEAAVRLKTILPT
jgi:unsaturated chondroitin disaccharide hydrolase